MKFEKTFPAFVKFVDARAKRAGELFVVETFCRVLFRGQQFAEFIPSQDVTIEMFTIGMKVQPVAGSAIEVVEALPALHTAAAGEPLRLIVRTKNYLPHFGCVLRGRALVEGDVTREKGDRHEKKSVL